MPGGSGAYSHSAGVEKIRQDVAKFIEGPYPPLSLAS